MSTMTATETDFAAMAGFSPLVKDAEELEQGLPLDAESEQSDDDDEEEEGLGFSPSASKFSGLGLAGSDTTESDDDDDSTNADTTSDTQPIGVKPGSEPDPNFNPSDVGFTSEEEDPEEDEVSVGPDKSRPLAQQPLPKIILVGAGVLALVCAVGGFLSVTGGSKTEQPIVQATSSPNADTPANPDQQSANYKTEAALGDQASALKSQKATAKGEVPSLKSSPTGGVVSAPAAPAAAPSVVPALSEATVTPDSPSMPLVSSTDTENVNATTPVAPIDPVAQWQMIASMGSLGRTQGVTGSSRSVVSYRPDTTPVVKTTPIASIPTPAPSNLVLSSIPGRGNSPIIIGSKASGRLVSPIVLAGDNSSPFGGDTSSAPKYLIQLTEPMNDSSGAVVIPTGSTVVTIVRSFNSASRLVDLQVVALVIGDKQYTVPLGAMVIRGQQNDSMIAQGYGTKGGGFLSKVLPSLFAGLSQGAQVLNQPANSSTFSSNGTVTSTSSGNNRNPGAAFISGAFGSLSQQILANSQTANQDAAKGPNAFYLDAGATLNLFANAML